MDLMFGDKRIDEADDLGFPLLFLALRENRMNPIIDQPDLPQGPLQEGQDEMVLPEINSKA
jgi:hypothetical protein